MLINDSFDLAVLRFLWKWKVSTTMGIATAIAPKRGFENVYRRLLNLEIGGYISTVTSKKGYSKLWQLEQKGFGVIVDELPDLREVGFRAEHLTHDLFCQAIHLGDWAGQMPEGCATFSEQELRRIESSCYDSWVPLTPSHRPDGWWLVTDGNAKRLVALEVEFKRKEPSSYKTVGRFYSESIKIDQVIWLVQTAAFASFIHRHLSIGTAGGASIHSMILKEDFVQHGWQSPIRIGKNSGQTLSSILNPKLTQRLHHSVSQVFLDGRKKPMKSQPSRPTCASDFF